MMIEILDFAPLRERLGLRLDCWTLPRDLGTLVEPMPQLRTQGSIWADCLDASATSMPAVEQELVRLQTVVGESDAVAPFSPVTRG
jgi:hypothetical protein